MVGKTHNTVNRDKNCSYCVYQPMCHLRKNIYARIHEILGGSIRNYRMAAAAADGIGLVCEDFLELQKENSHDNNRRDEEPARPTKEEGEDTETWYVRRQDGTLARISLLRKVFYDFYSRSNVKEEVLELRQETDKYYVTDTFQRVPAYSGRIPKRQETSCD